MEIKTIIEQIHLKNEAIAHEIELLFKMDDMNARLLKVLQLIDKYGNHPKLINQLVMNMRIIKEGDQLFDQINIEDIRTLFKSSLEISDDSELLLEFYYFLNALGEPLNSDFLDKKLNLIKDDIQEIITMEII